MLETVSVCVRPTCISVKPTPTKITGRGTGRGGRALASGEEGHFSRQQPNGSGNDGVHEGEKKMTKGQKERGEAEEVQFPDNMWSQLVGKRGYLAGDERWVLGEDEEGRVTVVRF